MLKKKRIALVTVFIIALSSLGIKSYLDWSWLKGSQKRVATLEAKIEDKQHLLSEVSVAKAEFIKKLSLENKWSPEAIAKDLEIMKKPDIKSFQGRAQWDRAINNVGQKVAEWVIEDFKKNRQNVALIPWVKEIEKEDRKLEDAIVEYESNVYDRNKLIEQLKNEKRFFSYQSKSEFPSQSIYQSMLERQRLAGK